VMGEVSFQCHSDFLLFSAPRAAFQSLDPLATTHGADF
jgi:hypothetical protein